MPELPCYLYKYRPLSGEYVKRVEAIICDNELYFAPPLSFNDPFDCKPYFAETASIAEKEKYTHQLLLRECPNLQPFARTAKAKRIARDPRNFQYYLETANSHFADFAQKMGVLSLSAINNDLLMWAHYADSHQGICLEFKSQFPFFDQADGVIYNKNRPQISLIKMSHEEMAKHAFMTKSDHWEYEKEWRILSIKKGHGACEYPKEALCGLIFGAQISTQNKEMVMEWISQRNSPIQVYQAHLSDKHFALEVLKVQR
jgi:hypothetical protein